ncbi:ribbon-helix-helix domain-containing protein [Nodularia sphaerocarpa]|uniref:ribbon-helix-helix domain-containing protein n=1 Tax=Nodularia sphaerocarpa TaxID=137816 RepID=UPI00232B3489|nr:ribbon-helix-helix domain-containing protein [Nodularia sphaerocarpa]MDB9372344.1 ribbon-helix-helix domain-containing protein [Nodularia sphaerocarpa CS-585]MDB9377960.1 ribbon-helix-helix domain-containing protein [Nodularia sphaerocarpa CS-585A2]
MPRPKRAQKDKYGETKQRYQIMLTETASLELDAISEELGITRSELLEKAIRQGLFKQVQLDPNE